MKRLQNVYSYKQVYAKWAFTLIATALLLTGDSMANEAPKTKCDEAGFIHAWVDVTPNIVYPTNPPKYPPKTEKCGNCGLIRKFIEHKKKEVVYEVNP